ncbi:MAG: hypothetical protein IT522_06905, partial [Burkholderiales bacterium]|nr:hypothetical protein [Burkholderiales bacterium]
PRLRRRADVRRRLPGGLRATRAAARADLRPGRVADDDHRHGSGAARGGDRQQRRRAPRVEAALDALCLAQIARFKRPKAYVFVDALPKNETGKVLKTALRETVQRGS